MVGFLKIGEERRGGGKMKRGEGKKGYGFLRLWLERVNRSCYKEFFCSKFSLGFFFSKVFWGIVFLNNRDKKQWKNQKKTHVSAFISSKANFSNLSFSIPATFSIVTKGSAISVLETVFFSIIVFVRGNGLIFFKKK